MEENRKQEKENSQVVTEAAKLLERMQAGDAGAFDELYLLTSSYVQFTVRKQLGEADDWEDVVQEAYITIFQQYPTLKNTQAALAWIKQIAFRKACDYSRKKYRKNESVDQSFDIADAVDLSDDTLPMPEDILENRETQADVRQAISELSEVQRNVLIGFYYNEMKVREIAEAMEIPEGTVKTALSRGRKSLKEKFEAKGYGKAGIGLSGAGLAGFATKAQAAGKLVGFLDLEAQAQAVQIPSLQLALQELAAKQLAAVAGKVIGAAGAAGTAGSSATGGAGALLAGKALPIILAAVIAGGGIGGTALYRRTAGRKIPEKQVEQMHEEQEERYCREEEKRPEREKSVSEQIRKSKGTVDERVDTKEDGFSHICAVLVRYSRKIMPGTVSLDDAECIRIAACAIPAEEWEGGETISEGADAIPVPKERVLKEAEALFGYRPEIEGLPEVGSYAWRNTVEEDVADGMAPSLPVARGSPEDGNLYLHPGFATIPEADYRVEQAEELENGDLQIRLITSGQDYDAADAEAIYDDQIQIRLKAVEGSGYGYQISKIRIAAVGEQEGG